MPRTAIATSQKPAASRTSRSTASTLFQRPPMSSRRLMRRRTPSTIKPVSNHSHDMVQRYCKSLARAARGCALRAPAREAPKRRKTTTAVCHSGASKERRDGGGGFGSDWASGNKVASSYNVRFAILAGREQGVWLLWKKSSSYRQFAHLWGSFKDRWQT